MISLVTQFFHGKMIACLTSCGKYSAFSRRAPDLINPSSSILGLRASNLLLPGSILSLVNYEYSSPNDSACADFIT